MLFSLWCKTKIGRPSKTGKLVFIILFFVTGCTEKKLQWFANPVEISGKVLGMQKTSEVKVSCLNPTAKIYKLNESGDLVQPVLAETPILPDGSYVFKAKEIGLSFKGGTPSVPSVVVVEGCSEGLSRPITGAKNQDISEGSSLLGFILNTSQKDKLAESLIAQQDKLKELIAVLQEAMTLTDAYAVLTSDSTIKSSFIEVLGVSPAILEEASPQVLAIKVPEQGAELEPWTLSASASHWLPTYDTVYIWKVDNQKVSVNPSFNYTPSANFQGTHTVTLYVGKNNGAGDLDLTKPYKTIARTIEVEDTAPAVAPGLVLVSNSPTSVTSVNIAIDTGAAMAQCASFSQLAVTVDEPVAPLDISRYTVTCTQSGSQVQSVELPSGDGIKVIRLWAKDASGNISKLASSVSILLEQNPPQVNLQNLASLVRGGSSQNIQFTAEDLGVGLEQAILEYAEDGSTFSEVAVFANPTTTNFSHAWVVPSHNTSSATLRVRAKDKAGNWTPSSSSPFSIDSMAPGLSLTSLNSGEYLGGSSQVITWTASDANFGPAPIKLEYSSDNGGSWQSIMSATGNSGSYSWTLPLVTSSQVRIRVTATDLAGNQALQSSTSALTIDSTAPNLPVVTLTSATYSNNSTASFGLSSCADVAKILINESLVPPPAADLSWQPCSLTPSYIVSGEGLHTMQVWVQDSVGNVNTLSVSRSMTLDTTAPMVSLTSLNSGSFQGEDVRNITWNASDINLAAMPTKLEYSADNGASWNTIIASTSNSGSYAWTLPRIDSSQVKVRVTVTDLATNKSSTQSSGTLVIDSTAPAALGLVRSSSSPTSQTAVAIDISTCAGDAQYMIFQETNTPPTSSDSGWVACGVATTYMVSTGDGTKTIYAWSKDEVGNISTASSVSVILDQTSPTLSMNSFNAADVHRGGRVENIAWSAADANFGPAPIKIEYSPDNGTTWETISAATDNDGTEGWTLPSIDSVQCKLRLTAVDLAGNPATVVSSAQNFIIDSSKPQVVTDSMFIGDSQSPVPVINNNILVDIAATDLTTTIQKVCFKYNTTNTPTESDTCWTSLAGLGISPSKNIAINDAPFRLGFAPSTYTVYTWFQDQAGNISELTNSLSGTFKTDKLTVDYVPGAAPTVLNVIASSNDSPANPPSGDDLTAASGATVFVKWTLTDDQPLGATPVQIFYTTDDVNWTLVSGGPFQNGVNGGCTISAPYTGCFQWLNGSPSSTFYRVKVQATDVSSLAASATSLSLNPMNIRFLAGNTDLGTNNSASGAILLPVQNNDIRFPSANSLVVHPSGVNYVIDRSRGVMKIDPADGLLKVFLKKTGTSSGDGGSVYNATARAPLKINLDYQNRMLIWDYDRIRRVNLSANPPTIETIVGGGTDSTSNTFANPLSLKYTEISSSFNHGIGPFTPLPNGDLFFKSEKFPETSINSSRFRMYQSSTNSVSSVIFQGAAIPGYPAIDVKNCVVLSATPVVDDSGHLQKFLVNYFASPTSNDPDCSYDNSWHYYSAYFDLNGNYIANIPNLGHGSLLLGRNFKNYYIRKDAGTISVLDPVANTWTHIAGAGQGNCEDDVLVTDNNCRLFLEDAFIDVNSKIYVLDRNTIRALKEDQTFVTLAGQPLSFGDGLSPGNARFAGLVSFDIWDNAGNLTATVLDMDGARFREFPIAGGAIQTIAGNGNMLSPTTTVLASETSVLTKSGSTTMPQFSIDKSNGNIYYGFGTTSIGLLSRSSGKWSRVIGDSSTYFYNGDGVAGASLRFNQRIIPLGFENGKLLASSNWGDTSVSGTHKPNMKFYNSLDAYRQSHFAGVTTNSIPSTYCSVGTNVADCHFSAPSGTIRAYYDSVSGGWVHSLSGYNSIRKLVAGGVVEELTPINQNIRSFYYYRRPDSSEVVYYCGVNGGLYKKEVGSGVVSGLSYSGVPDVICVGNAIVYSPTRNSLLFIYKKNELTGIAEILNP